MAQECVGQHAGDHRFADRHGSDAHVRVVAAVTINVSSKSPAMVRRAEMQPAAGDRPILIG
jgi:hypothetical protein